MYLCLALTISVALFGLTSAEMTALEILANHTSTCPEGTVAGLIAECTDKYDMCQAKNQDFNNPNQIKCYTPLRRRSFDIEDGIPRKCTDERYVVAYGDDPVCDFPFEGGSVVGCDRPLYCIWAKPEDSEKWERAQKIKYIEEDYPLELLSGQPCDDMPGELRWETGACDYQYFSFGCDYNFTCGGEKRPLKPKYNITKSPKPTGGVIIPAIRVELDDDPETMEFECPEDTWLQLLESCDWSNVCLDEWSCLDFGPGDLESRIKLFKGKNAAKVTGAARKFYRVAKSHAARGVKGIGYFFRYVGQIFRRLRFG